MSSVIEINNLTKYFRATLALDDVSLTVERGEVFGLLGPQGSGKSTLFQVIAGLVKPTSGSVKVFGKELRRNGLEIRSRTGIVIENTGYFEHLTVSKNLQLLSRLRNFDRNIDRSLDLVGIRYAADRRVGDLSPATRKRFAIATAILTEPELLILDEPAGGLNAEQTHDVLGLLRHLAAEASITVFVSTSIMREIEMLCDRVAILNQGKLVSCEQPDAVLSYDTKFLEVLIDHPDAAAKRLREEDWVVSADAAPGRVIVRLGDATPQRLMTYLIEKGYVLSGVVPRQRTLQEYFLKAMNV